MAKKSVRNRNQKRIKEELRLRAPRKKLRADASDIHLDPKERMVAGIKLQKMSLNSNPVRRRNRCKLCGRPRGYNRLTGLCRLHMRIALLNGMIPGMHKASW